jgi:hypothetical protein
LLRIRYGFLRPSAFSSVTSLHNSSFLLLPSRVCTIQRLYAMLRGEELNEEIDEKSRFELAAG